MKFRALTPTQARAFLDSVCEGEVDADVADRIGRMQQLTPGDFAAALKKVTILGISPTADAICRQLTQELDLNTTLVGGARQRVGF